MPFYKPPEDSPEMRYLKRLRDKLVGEMPRRESPTITLKIPPLKAFKGAA